MIIVHKLTEFLFDLFPKAKANGNSNDMLIEELEKYYTFGVYKPKVQIESDLVQIMIDIPSIINQKPAFEKAVAFCEKRKFGEAKPILEKLIKANPTVSEYHRVLGQIFSEEGNQDEAINCLIDALKWEPKNGYALIMMGNIFAREKDDFDTAVKYYDQAVVQNPKDHIAINNLGTNLIQMGKWEEGLKLLEKAYDINPNYPNTNYGIALANEELGNTLIAFDYAIATLKKCGIHDQNLFNHALSLTIKISEEWTKSSAGKKVFKEYKSYLEKESGKKIEVEPTSNIPTAAKIEFAENYDRDFHIIKYNEKYQAVEHLMMHELVHLDFTMQARKENNNMLFISDGNMKTQFIRDYSKSIKTLIGGGYNEASVTGYINALFEGINRQIFNAPIDLFIEDFLYENYHELKPFQFISLYGLVTQGKNAVTDKRATEFVPKEILSVSKMLNLVSALHFKDLFGFDLIAKFNALPFEVKEANRLYAEFLEYRKDRTAGEEYELVQHWGDDLKLNTYFELINEEEFRNNRTDIEGLLSSIEADPFGLESNKRHKEKEMKTFQEKAQEVGLNMAVVMFMVDAMQVFSKMSAEKIKATALEIAMLGTQGINPAPGNNYKLSNIPKKDFSGYNLLAFYYVSWAMAIPEKVDELNLSYEKEYEMALKMNGGGHA